MLDRSMMTTTTNKPPLDVKTSVGLDILRQEMQRLVDPPKANNNNNNKPTFNFRSESRQEDAKTTNGTTSATNKKSPATATAENRLRRLQTELEEQEEEQEKWTKLTSKLERRSQQTADSVIRLTTSVKVFSDELASRTDRLHIVTRQLQEQQDRATKQMNRLKQDHVTQVEQAARALDVATQADDELQDKLFELEQVEQRLVHQTQELARLEDRVQQLERQLHNQEGNTTLLSENQRDYMKAEWHVERDHRDKCRWLVEQRTEQRNTLQKDCTSLRGKVQLYRDEHQRRTLRAASLVPKLQEEQQSWEATIDKARQQVEAVRADRDAWGQKTQSLVDQLQVAQTESAKLKVKAQLFRQQLNVVNATVERLQARIQEEENELMSVRNNNTTTITTTTTSGREEPAPSSSSSMTVTKKIEQEEPTNNTVKKVQQPSSYVWQPPTVVVKQQQQQPVQKTESTTTTTTNKIVNSSSSSSSSGYILPPCKPPTAIRTPMVRVNSAKAVKGMLPITETKDHSDDGDDDDDDDDDEDDHNNKVTTTTTSNNNATSLASSSSDDARLSSKLNELQQDLQQQKRFQQEHARKMEQQLGRLATKVEVLAAPSHNNNNNNNLNHHASNNNSNNNNSTEEFSEMRKVLQQMNQQCLSLSQKLEGISTELNRRDQQQVTLEQRFLQKESQYFEQMEFLRGEMQRQLEKQQQAFADQMTNAVLQMQQAIVMADAANRSRGGGSSSLRGGQDSTCSLESLYPAESPRRPSVVRFVDTTTINEGEIAHLFAPTIGGTEGGFTMASGIMMKSPLFQNMAAAVEKSKAQQGDKSQ